MKFILEVEKAEHLYYFSISSYLSPMSLLVKSDSQNKVKIVFLCDTKFDDALK